jgi:hypothetical protein
MLLYTHTHTHTHTTLAPHFTKNVSLLTTRSSEAKFWLHHRHRPRQASFVKCHSCLPTCAIVSTTSFKRMNRESLYEISSPPWRKEKTDPARSEEFPLHQWHLKKTNCWTRDLPMFVGPVAGVKPLAGVTPLTYLRHLPRPHRCCRSGPLLRKSRCPKPVKISSLGTGTRISYTHSSKTAFWGKNIQFGWLLRIWSRLSCSETLYISAP